MRFIGFWPGFVLLACLCNSDVLAEELTIFDSTFTPIEGKPCSDKCSQIIDVSIQFFKKYVQSNLKVFVLPRASTCQSCQMYGADNFKLLTYQCTTAGNLFDHIFKVEWKNLTFVCQCELNSDLSKTASIIASPDVFVGQCTNKTAAVTDTLPYAKVDCPSASGGEDKPVNVTVKVPLGKFLFDSYLRGDMSTGTSEILRLKATVANSRPVLVDAPQNSWPALTSCLHANRKTVARKTFKNFLAVFFACTRGADITFPIMKSLVSGTFRCAGLPQ